MALPLVRVGQTLQQAQDNVNQNQTPNQGLRLFRVGEDNKTFLEYARWAAEQRKRQEEERLRQEEERKRLANIPAYTSRSGQNLSQNQLNNQFYTQPKNFQELAHTGRDTSPQVSNEPGLLGQMKNGFLQGAANAEKNFFTTMTKISEKLTPNSKIPQLMKNAEKGYQEILDEHPEWDAPEGTKWNSITGIARAVTGTVPFMLMSATSEVVGNLLLPGAGASAAFSVTYTTEYGAAYNEAIALGATEEQAKKAAQGTGIINGIIEALPLEMITLGLWELPEKFVFKKVRSAAAKYAASASKKILTTAATEGAEEALQEFTSNYFAKKHYDEDRKLTDGVIEAYVLGAITGGILAGGTHTIEVLTSKRGEFIQQAKKEGISEEKAAAYFDEMIDDINQQQKQKSQEQQEQQEQRQEQPTEQPKTFEDTQPLQEPQPFQTIQEQEIEQQSTQTAQQQQKAEIEPIKQEITADKTNYEEMALQYITKRQDSLTRNEILRAKNSLYDSNPNKKLDISTLEFASALRAGKTTVNEIESFVKNYRNITNLNKKNSTDNTMELVNEILDGKHEDKRLSSSKLIEKYIGNKNVSPNDTIEIFRADAKNKPITSGQYVTISEESATRYVDERPGTVLHKKVVKLQDLLKTGARKQEFTYLPTQSLENQTKQQAKISDEKQGISVKQEVKPRKIVKQPVRVIGQAQPKTQPKQKPKVKQEVKQEVKKPTKKLFTTKAEIKGLKQRISEIKETKELRVKEKNAISKGLEKIDVKEGVSLHLWKTEGKVINYEIKTAKVEAQRAIKFIEKNPKKALEITLGMKDNTTGIDSTMLSSVMIKTLKNAGEHSLAQDVATKQSLNITRSAQNVSFAQNDFRPQEAPLIASIEKAKFEEFARKEGIKNKKKAREVVEDIVKEKAETLSKEVNKEAMNKEANMKALDDWLQTILC